MPMSNPSNFDVLAGNYDTAFTESRTGSAQRSISRKWLQPLLQNKTGLQILEINCGTGDDAYWLASQGHQVTATDQSAAMIQQAQQKAKETNNPVFHTCAFDSLIKTFPKQHFDLVFSNFAGLNCISPADLFVLSSELHALLKPGGHLAVVIFGKRCLWEALYYLGRSQPKESFRRWTSHKVMVHLSNGVHQPVYYYSIRHFAQLMYPMQLVQKKPVGLFVPPSYMEAVMQQRGRLFRTLLRMEQRTNWLSMMSHYADHVYLLFKKGAV
jgi:ubiquinone/menaquinone biosynthesis C-methylase UbiE